MLKIIKKSKKNKLRVFTCPDLITPFMLYVKVNYIVMTDNYAYPTGRNISLEFKLHYFANGKFAEFKFHLLLHF